MLKLSDYLLPDGRYYFDNAATTKMSKEALKVYNETAERWFMNPMSYKDFDPEIDKLLQGAREHTIDFLHGNPYRDRVVFTSGATESINLLLKGYYFAHFNEKRKIITSPIEHKAVLETCKYLESIGAELEYVNITAKGEVDYDHLEQIIDSQTLFVCLMHVNNETGEISDLERIYDIATASGTKFFTDTTQSITKLDVNSAFFDACVGSAHKFHGPKGVGFLYLKEGVELSSILHGGAQEYAIRAGTTNLPSILSMQSVLYINNTNKAALFGHIYSMLEYNKIIYQVLLDKSHISIVSTVESEISKIRDLFIFSRGSACQSGLIQESEVYKRVFKQQNPIIRISL